MFKKCLKNIILLKIKIIINVNIINETSKTIK